jgi:hypothetical protein
LGLFGLFIPLFRLLGLVIRRLVTGLGRVELLGQRGMLVSQTRRRLFDFSDNGLL